MVVGPTVLLQRVAANAPLHYSSTLVITRQRTRRPHVARAPAAAAVVRVTRTHLRVVKLTQPELVLLVVIGGGVLHWRRRVCVRRREEGNGRGSWGWRVRELQKVRVTVRRRELVC